MAGINPTISIMTLNVKRLNNLIKGRNCQMDLKKKDPTIYCLQEKHFRFKIMID